MSARPITTGARRAHTVLLVAVLALAALLVPDSAHRPAVFSLTRVENAKHVDFTDGVVWILAVGVDARPGEAIRESRADALQLVGIDFDSGRAVGVGIPRDSWVEIPGHGMNRINTAMAAGGTELLAQVVDELVGIAPEYVFVADFPGFRRMLSVVGGVQVRSPYGFDDPGLDVHVRKGVNRFDADQALNYARSRRTLQPGDFARSANQQLLMMGILRQLREHEDEDGFMERGALAALTGLDTDLSPTELYRLAQAVTQVEPTRVQLCVLPGAPHDVGALNVVFPDEAAARRIGADVRKDVVLDRGC